MSTILKRFTKGIVLRAEPSDNAENAEGSLFQNSSDARIKTYIQGAVREVLTNSQSQVLTYKTLQTDSSIAGFNTIQTKASGNLAATELNAALSELQGDIDTRALDSSLTSHTGASSGVHGVTGSVVGTSDSQALINKTIVVASNTITTAASGNLAAVELNAALAELQGDVDTRALSVGGSIQSPVRLDVKKDTKANLLTYAATASNGQLCFATDTKEMFQVLDGALVSVGSGGTSNVDALLTQTFDESALTDFTQTGLALIETNPMNGKKTARLIHQAATTQSFKYVKAVDPKYRGKNLTMSFQVRSSATAGNVTLNIYDETNAANIISSQSITLGSVTVSATTNSNTTLSGISSSDINKLKVGQTVTGSGIATGTTISAVSVSALTATLSQAATASATVTLKVSDLPQKQSASFDVPTNCASISYTISALAESGLPETYVDDVVIQLTSAALTSTSVTVPVNNDTEWASYTPTFTGFGTVTNISFYYKRQGSDVLVRGRFTEGTTTATEARVSLPTGLISSSTIVTLEIAGSAVTNTADSAAYYILREPSVNYATFGRQVTSTYNGLAKRLGSQMDSGSATYSIEARVPIQGWLENETTSKTIPLTSAVFATQPDSQMTWFTMTGYSSTRTRVPYFSAPRNMVGSAISWTSSAINGLEVTVQESGYYDLHWEINTVGGGDASHYAIGLNTADFTTAFTSLRSDFLDYKYRNGANHSDTVHLAYSGPLNAGDKVYPLGNSSTSYITLANTSFAVSKVGSTKQINISSDQKIDLPTHSLEMGAYAGCGSTNTRVAYFASTSRLIGDAFTIVNDAVNGFSLTCKKKGELKLNLTIGSSAGSPYISISRNATQFSVEPQSMTAGQNIASTTSNTSWTSCVSTTVSANIGDVFRVHVQGAVAPLGSLSNLGLGLIASLVEDKVQVSLSNVLPQFTQSDSSVRVDGVNGYGSAGTRIRRFSNIRDNIGTAIVYNPNSDEAINGASFLIKESGNYQISYTDGFSSTGNLGITKNAPSLTTDIQNVPAANMLAWESSSYGSVSWSGYLEIGDIIRPHTNALGTGGFTANFTISKVGKPNLTSVDVTPFTNYKGTDTESIRLDTPNGSGSTNTCIKRFSITRLNTNKGIIQYNDSATAGASFTVLKNCYIIASWTHVPDSNANYGLSVNSTQLTTTYDSISMTNKLSGALTATGTAEASAVYAGFVSAGDVLRPHGTTSNNTARTTREFFSIMAIAEADQIVSPISSFSSDTASLVYAPSTSYTLSTLANAPVGTFITFTSSAGSNAQTQTTTAPTQSVSDMNVNGIQITGRGLNQTSTAAAPAVVAIQIGKGFKGVQVSGYRTTGKTGVVSLDNQIVNANINTGLSLKDYNENTGVLIIDAAFDRAGSTNNRYFICDDPSNVTLSTPYLVINASKSPSLAAVPQLQPRIATLSDVKASGTQGGASIAGTQTRTLNTIVDSSGIVTSLASNQFTLQAGEYYIEASAPAYTVNQHKIRLRNITDSVTSLSGTSEYSFNSNGVSNVSSLKGTLVINSAKVFELQHYTAAAAATNGLGVMSSSGESEVYSIVKIQRVK